MHVANGHFVQAQALRKFFVDDISFFSECADIEVQFRHIKSHIVDTDGEEALSHTAVIDFCK